MIRVTITYMNAGPTFTEDLQVDAINPVSGGVIFTTGAVHRLIPAHRYHDITWRAVD